MIRFLSVEPTEEDAAKRDDLLLRHARRMLAQKEVKQLLSFGMSMVDSGKEIESWMKAERSRSGKLDSIAEFSDALSALFKQYGSKVTNDDLSLLKYEFFCF